MPESIWPNQGILQTSWRGCHCFLCNSLLHLSSQTAYHHSCVWQTQLTAYPISILSLSSEPLFCFGNRCAPIRAKPITTRLSPAFPGLLLMGWQWKQVLTDDIGAMIGFPDQWGRPGHSSLLFPFLPALHIEAGPTDTPATLWPWAAVRRPKESQQCQPWRHGATETQASSFGLLNTSETKIHWFQPPYWLFILLKAKYNIVSDTTS